MHDTVYNIMIIRVISYDCCSKQYVLIQPRSGKAIIHNNNIIPRSLTLSNAKLIMLTTRVKDPLDINAIKTVRVIISLYINYSKN